MCNLSCRKTLKQFAMANRINNFPIAISLGPNKYSQIISTCILILVMLMVIYMSVKTLFLIDHAKI